MWTSYLQKRCVGPILHPFDAFGHGPVRLQVVEVKSLFARAQHVGDGRAVADGEADLHVDALCRPPVDVGGEQPVVLAGLKDIAHLVRADGVEVLVVPAHLLPLGGERVEKRERGEGVGGGVSREQERWS